MTIQDVFEGKEKLLYDWGGLLVLKPVEIGLIIGILLLVIFDYYNVQKLKKYDNEIDLYRKRKKTFKIRSGLVLGILLVGYTGLSVMNMDLREVDNYKNHPNYEKWVTEYMIPYISELEPQELDIIEVKYLKGYYHINTMGSENILKVAEEDIKVVDGIKRPKSIKAVVLEEDFEYYFKKGQLVPVEQFEFSKGFIQDIKK